MIGNIYELPGGQICGTTVYYDNDLRSQIINLESWNQVPSRYRFNQLKVFPCANLICLQRVRPDGESIGQTPASGWEIP